MLPGIDAFHSSRSIRKGITNRIGGSTQPNTANSGAQNVSRPYARTFFEKATRGEVTKAETSGELAVVASENDDVICFTSRRMEVTPAADQALPSEGMELDASGFGGVHTSAFSQ